MQCISDDGSDGLCVDGVALRGASSVTVARDGASVYVTAGSINALTTHARGAVLGRLCTRQGPGFASEIVVSGDGRTLFAATSDSVVAFERDTATGALRQTGRAENYRTYVSCLGDLEGVSGASGIATAVDGRNLYVTSAGRRAPCPCREPLARGAALL